MGDGKRERRKRKSGSSFGLAAAVFFCLLLTVAGFVGLRLRGGVQVRAPREGEYLSDREVVFFRQDDKRWEKDRLGASEYTMGSSGCLVSCIASALSMESGEDVTPATLNMKLSAENIYDGEGNLQWEPLAGLGEYQVAVYGSVSSDQIDACLSAGHFPIVRVRMYALGDIHYVLIVGAEDGTYLCMDPLRDEIRRLSGYGNRIYAVRCVYPMEEGTEEHEEGDGSSNTGDGAFVEDGGASSGGLLPKTDLNRNGIPEELRVMETEEDGKRLEIWEAGAMIFEEEGYYVHGGRTALFLCRLDGGDYLLRYHPTMYQGFGDYSYMLFTMEGGEETPVEWEAISFDINFGSPIHGEFEPEAIAAFMEKINNLLSHSVPLLDTEEELLNTFEKEGKLQDTLWWLDREETGFHRDPSKSLSENLQDFQAAMREEKE